VTPARADCSSDRRVDVICGRSAKAELDVKTGPLADEQMLSARPQYRRPVVV
jgi:hypothetical protein